MSDRILLAHGDGGILSHLLITEVFHKHLVNNHLTELKDAALLDLGTGTTALTTDSFVVKPIFFPGGNIGKLAIAGTVNDLAVSGAVPKYLTAAFIIEEGMLISELEEIVKTMAETAKDAGVMIVAGDTKVVERGSVDSIYINTTGIGQIPVGRSLGYNQVEVGDVVIINGNIGDHGIAIMSKRAGLEFNTPVESDCATLNGLIETLIQEYGDAIKFMRDPTRGGVATTLKEIALSTDKDIILKEEALPISEAVEGLADMLGLDPLYLANEGKVLIVAKKEIADEVIATLRGQTLGKNARIIGEIQTGQGNVYLKTAFGGTKILDMLAGAPLPRIC